MKKLLSLMLLSAVALGVDRQLAAEAISLCRSADIRKAKAAELATLNDKSGIQAFAQSLLKEESARILKAAQGKLGQTSALRDFFFKHVGAAHRALVHGDELGIGDCRTLRYLARGISYPHPGTDRELKVAVADTTVSTVARYAAALALRRTTDQKTALAIFQALNLPAAQNQTGEMLQQGEGGTRDHAKAVELFKTAAAGSIDAAINLAQCQLLGLGTPEDFFGADEILSTARMQRAPSAHFLRFEQYYFGLATPVNRAISWQHAEKAAKLNHPEANYWMGVAHYHKRCRNASTTEARRYFLQAAKLGHSRSMYLTGEFLYRGLGGTEDKPAGVSWICRAADAGYVMAMARLIHLKGAGAGVPAKAYEDAVKRGAALNDVYCMAESNRLAGKEEDKKYRNGVQYYTRYFRRLGQSSEHTVGLGYCYGYYGVKDGRRALEWLRMGAERASHGRMAFAIGWVYDYGRRMQPRDPVKALTWYMPGVHKRHVEPMVNMGEMFLLGKSVPKDFSRARQLFERDVERRPRSRESNWNLGRMYENGWGVEQDLKQALAYYEKSRKKKEIKRVEELLKDWETRGRKQEFKAELGLPILCRLLPDDRVLAVGDEAAVIWDKASVVPVQRQEFQLGKIKCAALSPNGKRLVLGTPDHRIVIWDLGQKKVVAEIAVANKGARALTFLSEKEVVIGCLSGQVFRWTIGTTELVAVATHKRRVRCIAVSPDARLVATSGVDRVVRVTGLADNRELAAMTGHDFSVRDLLFAGEKVISCSDDMTIKIWSHREKKQLHSLTGHDSLVTCLSISRDGKSMLSAGTGGNILLWDLKSRKVVGRYTDYPEGVQDLHMAADAKIAIILSRDGRLWLFELKPNIKEVQQP